MFSNAVGCGIAQINPTHSPSSDVIHLVIVIAILGEGALHLEVCDQATLIPDGCHLGVLDGAQAVCNHTQATNAEGQQAAHVGVVQSHLQQGEGGGSRHTSCGHTWEIADLHPTALPNVLLLLLQDQGGADNHLWLDT